VGFRTMDPATNKTTTLLNNYFGSYFNTIDDLSVHPKTGDIWFTDPDYSWFNALTNTAPQLPVASYRFRPSTGATYLVSDDIVQPNGIAFTPDGNHLYISDTGAVDAPIDGRLGHIGTQFNATGARTIYKYDVSADGTYIYAKRPLYLAQDWIPDGLKVAQNGYIVTGAGYGVDILDSIGTPLVRVQTNYTIQSFVWTGKDLTTLWIMGNGGISKVEFALKEQELK
jgi:sugar lactone lactonase YvrE